jgi:hypothetical protein
MLQVLPPRRHPPAAPLSGPILFSRHGALRCQLVLSGRTGFHTVSPKEQRSPLVPVQLSPRLLCACAHALPIGLAYNDLQCKQGLRECVFYYCRTYYKAVRVGGGGE